MNTLKEDAWRLSIKKLKFEGVEEKIIKRTAKGMKALNLGRRRVEKRDVAMNTLKRRCMALFSEEATG